MLFLIFFTAVIAAAVEVGIRATELLSRLIYDILLNPPQQP